METVDRIHAALGALEAIDRRGEIGAEQPSNIDVDVRLQQRRRPARPPGWPIQAFERMVVPPTITNAGETATRRFLEFLAATICNRNTRLAYYRAVRHFFAWSEHHQLGGLDDIEPLHIGAYVEQLQASKAKPTVKQHLATIRMLFDWLVIGEMLATNPVHAVCGPKHVVKRGKTLVLTPDQER